MNNLCCVVYGADDKNKIYSTDIKNLRIITCNHKGRYPGFFARRKIKKLCRKTETFDRLGIAENLLTIQPKCLFRRDIARCIEEYALRFNINLSKQEIAVYGRIDAQNIQILSEKSKMLWLFGNNADDIHNAYSPAKYVKTDIAIYADSDYDVPESNLIFNLTEIPFNAVNDIIVSVKGVEFLDESLKNNIVFTCGFSYEITNFIK